MLPALQKDDALLADIASVSLTDRDLHVWWLGQSGFLVQQAGRRFLFDPYLSDSLTKKYAATDKPHVRMTERCLSPERIPRALEFVTASHLHTDHLDAETLVPLAHAHGGIHLFLPPPIMGDAAARLGDAPVELHRMGDHDVFDTPAWQLRGIAAAHNEILRDEWGDSYCTGFILKVGGFTLYHSGDTLWHDGLVETLRDHACDLMLLPINGNRPERRVSGNLNGTEAAALAKACQARLVVPCHYDMFTFNTETTEEFTTACQRLGQEYRVLQCGERLSLAASAR